MAAASCTSAGGDRLAEAGLPEVKAAAGLTRQGTAAVRLTDQVVPGQSTDDDVITGRWDFTRRQGVFRSAGAALVVAYGAEFEELSAAERAAQAADAPEYRHGWTQRRVPTADDIHTGDYFGLALESVSTFADGYSVLDRATAADDLGLAEVAGTPTRHLRVTVDTTELGAEPPEVWLDREGRARRLRLSVDHETVRVTLVIELSDFGTVVDVEVPPIDQLDPSGEVVPVDRWKVVRAGEEAGRPWQARVAPSNRTTTKPPAQGRCLALEIKPIEPPGTPPVWYDCHAPHNPVGLNRVLPPALRGQVVAGTAEPSLATVAVTFTDGSATAAPVIDGVFVLFTAGRTVATVAGQPVD